MSGGDFASSCDSLEKRLLSLMAGARISDEEFNDCSLAIHHFQRQHNAPYANYCQHINASQSIASWKSIPAVPQSAFRDFGLRTFSESHTAKTFRTSGTSGEGFGSHHFYSLKLYERSILRCWELLCLPKLPQIILTPSPDQAPHSSLSHMMATLRSCAQAEEQHFCLDNNGRLDPNVVTSHIERHIANDTPIMLLGTALAFLNFFEDAKCKNAKWILPARSAALETGGYKGSRRKLEKTQLYSLFHECLGLKPADVINEYSMTELSSQFYSRGVGTTHEGPPWARALVIDPETEREAGDGKVGTLRIFDLANLGSVIAIQTRDLAVRRGNDFELIGRDPTALPRGCSRAAEEGVSQRT